MQPLVWLKMCQRAHFAVLGFQVNVLEAFRPRGTDAHSASKRADQTAKGLFDPR